MNIWQDESGALDIIKDRTRYGVFWDMGVGKTALLLALIDHKIFQGRKKFLIIAPKKVTLSTWQKEVAKWKNFNYMAKILELIESGDPKKRTKQLENTGEYCIHIISSDIAWWLAGKFVEHTSASGKKYKRFVPNPARPDYDVIIVDECSEFKSVTTYRYKALDRLAKGKELFLLSGTPTPNIKREVDKRGFVSYRKADELYYICYFLGLYDGTITGFRRDFCYQLAWEYDWRMREEVYKFLQDKLRNYAMSRPLKLDVKLIEQKIYCPIDNSVLKEMIKNYQIETENFTKITAANRAVMIDKTLQLSNGFMYNADKKAIRFNQFKFNALLEVLEKHPKENALIYYHYEEDREFILRNLPGSKRYSSRQDEEDWNAGKIKYMLVSPFSDKFGLNLQFGGRLIIWFGLIWSGESFAQAIRRLYRNGQTRDVYVYYLLAKGGFDDYVYNVAITKVETTEDFKKYLTI